MKIIVDAYAKAGICQRNAKWTLSLFMPVNIGKCWQRESDVCAETKTIFSENIDKIRRIVYNNTAENMNTGPIQFITVNTNFPGWLFVKWFWNNRIKDIRLTG